ncbi:MAG: tetratricopeptide repeat protein [Flavobacteriales bacterium]|nr:tetratricopeptide repeat protein [Flavobacteriales bacterium]
MKLLNIILFLILFGVAPNIKSQEVDELKEQLKNDLKDTTRLRVLVEISNECEFDEIEFYAQKALTLSDSILQSKKYPANQIFSHKATAINNLAFLYHAVSEYEKAKNEYDKSLKIFYQVKDTNGIIMAYNNIAMVLKDMGDIDLTLDYLDKAYLLSDKIQSLDLLHMTFTNYSAIYIRMGLIDKALTYAYKGLKIQEQIGGDYGKGYALNNIASLFYMQKDYEKAEVYYLKSLEVREKINDEIGVATVYNNLAKVYDVKGDNKKAEEYYFKCLDKRKEINTPEGVAQSYSNLGLFYFKMGQIDKTKSYYNKAIKIREEINEQEGLGNSYLNMSEFLISQGRYQEAEDYGIKAMKIAKQLGFTHDIESSANILSKIYEKKNNYRLAYDFYKLHIELRDSLFSEENQKSVLTKQINYEYEKKKLTDSLQFAKEQEVKDLAIAKQEAQLKQEKTQRIALYGGLLVIIIFAGFVYNRFRISQQQKKIIELQKVEVEQQKEVVEEKNKEILDSIHYAKRIQAAILPPDKSVKELLPNSFILYKPKDIVAGDFYWLEKKNNQILFAAADCTGHGVPGAMVSVVCNNGLNRSVREHGLTNPGEILNKTREIVIAEFEKSEDEVKDGVDIAICNLEGNILQYAGANNPLWIVRNGMEEIDEIEEIEEIKADKQPIGKYAEPKPYTNHTIQVDKGDTIYIFSDGYVDQFGGEKGKKLKAANFKKLLLSIQNQPLNKQKEIINQTFEDWKGDLEQLDDVCIIGVRI